MSNFTTAAALHTMQQVPVAPHEQVANGFNQHQNLWGLDMGGTKIEGVILQSASNPHVLFRDRMPTEASQGYEHMLRQVGALVERMEQAAGYRPGKIGIGTPGTMIPQSGLMKNCNTTALNGRPLKADLEYLLGRQVVIANDANCFALSETRLGIVKQQFPGARVVFGIILGTGVGGGLVVNGQIIEGFHGIAGEWGHNYLSETDGKPCFCGKTGCIESILAGPALELYYAEQSGRKLGLKEIMQRATDGVDPAAVQTLHRLTHYFGLALSAVVNVLDPDVIVIGGGVGNISELYSAGVANIEQHIFDHHFAAPVVKPMLGDSAGVFGAAYLVA
ncbi:ROK family protein [Hymenobacter tibetensis]|uniref:ROK family protein n=1 Tax=Hymenobacter tibetensis TaxID=497967 RepID=A0ABY4CVD5_9BACT|nr:ROK family protein [Hymenobacter tibetensis]UOG74002.1 ROK family protein [Hymenobacter tibetensis]